MGKVEAIIKSEIVRLSKRELRKVTTPLKKDIWALKNAVSQLRKTVLHLERFVALQKKEWEKKPPLEAAPEEVETARLSPKLIRSLRKRLHLSQRDLARLVGVTPLAIYQWETGVFKPKKEKRSVLVALRKLGRREAKRLLEELKAGQEQEATAPKKKAKPKSSKK